MNKRSFSCRCCRVFVVAFLSILSATAWATAAPASVKQLVAGQKQIANQTIIDEPNYGLLVQKNGATPLYQKLQAAWSELARQVNSALDSGDDSFSGAQSVAAAYQQLEALDTLYQHRLQVWAASESYPGSTRDAIAVQLTRYNSLTASWRDLMKAWLGRAASVNEGSLAGFWYWLTDFYSQWQLHRLSDAIADANSASRIHPILGNDILPHAQTPLAVALTRPTAPIVPVYARTTEQGVVSADLANSDLAQLSPAVLTKAKELDYDPIKIFDFVQRNIDARWYAGAMQGAERTLTLGSGNDVDTAALLVALLRASTLPARYETGIVRLPVDYLQTATGITDAADQLHFLQRHGRAVEAVVTNGRISAFDLEYTWVAVRVPYANYRGAEVDASGKAWIALMPSAMVAKVGSPFDFLAASGVASTNLTAAYQQSLGDIAPTDWLAARVDAALSQSDREHLESLKAGKTTELQTLGLLPASLPLDVQAVSEESTLIPERLQHKVHIFVDGGNGQPILDAILLLAQVDGQRLTLSWMPATREDQNTVNAFGGINTTPAWSVSLRPQLRLNGRRVAVGEAGMPMGELSATHIELMAPYGTQKVNRNWMVGGYYALSIVAQSIEAKVDYTSRTEGDTEASGARLLSQLAARYNRAWLTGEQQLDRLTGYRVAHPWPLLTIAANGYQRVYVLDQLQSLQWKNVTLDAALHVSEPVAMVANPVLSNSDWMQVNALQGSWLESNIFNEMFSVDAVSADKGLRLAAKAATPILTLAPGASASVLSLPAHVIAAIQHWLDAGFNVLAPQQQVTYQDWTGAVWRVQDPATGSLGYFISGGIAGGAATQSIWPVQEYQEAMELMYSDPADKEAKIGAIRQLGADWTIGMPAQKAEPLVVQVVDVKNHPVAGKEVHFSLLVGDIKLKTTTAITNLYGVATTEVTFGTQVTSGNTSWMKLENGDKYVSQVGISLVDAWVTDLDRGVVHTRHPVHVILRPGPASLTNSQLQASGLSVGGIAGLFSGNLSLLARDDHGNLVANTEFGASYSYSGGGADTQPGGVSVYGDCRSVLCASSSVTGTSYTNGTSLIQVIRGVGVDSETYTLTLDGAHWKTLTVPGTINTAGVGGSDPSFTIDSTIHVSKDGKNNTATRVGKPMPYKKYVTIMWPQHNWTTDQDGRIKVLHTLKEMIPVEPGGFSFTAPHVSIDSTYLGNGKYELSITGGNAPTVDWIQLKGKLTFHALAAWDPNALDPVTNKPGAYVEDKDITFPVDGWAVPGEVWVINPQVDGVTSKDSAAPDKIIVGQNEPAYPHTSTARTTLVNTHIEPANYPADIQAVELRQDENVVAYQPFPGDGQAVLENGLPIDLSKQYSLRYRVNGQILSEPYPVQFYQPTIIYPEDKHNFQATIVVDYRNDWSCMPAPADTAGFALAHPATVMATLDGDPIGVDGKGADYKSLLAEGYHHFSSNRFTLGLHSFEINSISSLDGHEETRSGTLSVGLNSIDLGTGQTLVEGVNTFNGSLNLSRNDFTLDGRGPGIQLQRFYNSNRANKDGLFGKGWGASLGGAVISLGCGAYQVNGGLGGGGRFFLKNGVLVPEVGRHGRLKEGEDGNSFDYYTTDGTHYHYQQYPFDRSSSWSLAYIQDTNGNQVSFTYAGSSTEKKLLFVQDAAGRKLTLHYNGAYSDDEHKVPLVGSITGPEGYAVNYSYDEYGRLLNVTTLNKGGVTKVEAYGYPGLQTTYDPSKPYQYQQRNLLTSVTDPLGYTTSYTYQHLPFNVNELGEAVRLGVRTINKTTAQNGTVQMQFTFSDRRNLSGAITTDITNFRGNENDYVLDRQGHVLSQSLPSIQNQWNGVTGDLTSRTEQYQGGNLTTAYTYDANGNITSITLNGGTPIKRSWLAAGSIRNRLKSETDRNGYTTKYTYDSGGNLTEIDYPEGVTASNTYAGNGDRLSHRDRSGNATFFTYDANGYLAKVDATDCCDKEMAWNALGYQLSVTNGLGNQTIFDHDGLGHLLATHYPDGTSTSSTYDAAGNRISHVDGKGTVITYTYDDSGHKASESWPDNISRQWTYDPAGNLTGATDFRGVTTTYAYDGLNHLIETQTVGANSTRQVQYQVDQQGNIVKEDHGDGRITTRSFNVLGLATAITDAVGDTTTQTFDEAGNLLTHTDRNGNTATYAYDGLNRKVAMTDALGHSQHWQYDGNGNVMEHTDANGNVTTQAWNQQGKPVSSSVADAQGAALASHHYHYDAADNLVQEINSRGAVTRFTYDKRGRRTSKAPPAPLGATTYRYDANGNLTKTTLPNSNEIVQTWDKHNRLLSKNDKLGALQAFSYDANGNILTQTDAKGATTSQTWTDFNQLKSQSLPEQQAGDLLITYDYDAQGNQRFKRETDKVTPTTPTPLVWETRYDTLNRPVTTLDPLGNTITTAYDPEGNVLSVTDANGNVTTHDYDALGRRTASHAPLGLHTTQTWDANGNLLTQTDGNGITTKYTYDGLNRRIASDRDGLLISRRTLDGEGNLLLQTDANSNTTSYEYDDANLLIQETGEEAAVTRYTYDSQGNPITRLDPENFLTTTAYDLRDRQTSQTNALGETTRYEYDGNGNRTARILPLAHRWAYVWNLGNDLAKVTDPAGNITTYTYDGRGNRLTTTDANNHTTQYAYDALSRLTQVTQPQGESHAYLSYDGNGNLLKEQDAKGQIITHQYDALNREIQRQWQPAGVSP